MRRKGEEVVGTAAELSPLFIICCWLQHVVWKRGRRWTESGGVEGGKRGVTEGKPDRTEVKLRKLQLAAR